MKTVPADRSPKFPALLILALAVAGIAIWVARPRSEIPESDASPAPVATQVSGPIAEDEVPAPVAPPPVVSVPTAPAPEPAQKAANPMAALMQQTMSNPAMRQMIETQLRQRFETEYAEMFGLLGFTEEQKGRYLNLMGEITFGLMNGPMQGMFGGQSNTDQKSSAQPLAAMKAEAEQKMTDFFAAEFPGDPSKLEAFKRYDETETDRRQVNAFQSSLTRIGEPLTAEQRDALIGINFEERKNQVRPVSSPDEQFDLSKAVSEEALASSAERTQQVQERVLARAAAVLSPSQLDALREHNTARAKQSQAGAEMMKAMMGAGAPSPK